MKTVYKYDLEPLEDVVELQLPRYSQILKVDTQLQKPRLWALVETEQPLETRKFRVAGTGHEIKEQNTAYIGTVFMHSGFLVFHVFELY
jgi:hypothetical protein